MFFEIDILLSLRITNKSLLRLPEWLKASNAIPAVKAPSPITAIAFSFEPTVIPRAALIEVLE